MADATKTLLIGTLNDLVQNEVYALPARLVHLTSTVALEYTAGTTGGSYSTLTNATSGTFCSAAFVRSTTGAARVFVKV